VLGVSWVARALFVVAIGDAHAADVGHWEGALAAQDAGENPYETGVLNWPPLWLMVIVAVDYASSMIGLEFWDGLRIWLSLVESALVVTLYATLVSVGAERRSVRRALLVGIALNPVAILLVCLHGNSDVQVGLLVTLAVSALCAHWRSRDVVLWLLGCLFLGLGVLAKTAPLVLAPILAPGARVASRAARGLGVALFLGPAALGLGVIAVLVPIATWDHVITYRSTRGFFAVGGVLDERFFGFAGWLDDVTGVDPRVLHERVFTIAVVLALVWLCRRLWRSDPLGPERLFLVVATVLMVVVALGPGYGPQYAYWFLPALIGTYVLLDPSWRRLLLVTYVVAALTYAVEYAVVPWLGAYALAVAENSDWLADAGDYLDSPHRLVLFRLPLLAVYLLVIVAAIRRLAAPDRYEAKLWR
jgi:MFS family permease